MDYHDFGGPLPKYYIFNTWQVDSTAGKYKLSMKLIFLMELWRIYKKKDEINVQNVPHYMYYFFFFLQQGGLLIILQYKPYLINLQGFSVKNNVWFQSWMKFVIFPFLKLKLWKFWSPSQKNYNFF